MRILLQIIQFPPDVNSTGLLMSQICEGLIAHGHEVEVITSFPHYERFRILDAYKGKLAQRDRFRDMSVLRVYVYAPGKKTLRRRLLSYVSFNLLATSARLFSNSSHDVVLCPNGSFFTGVSAHLGRGFAHTPFVYNVQDLYPEVAIRSGQLRSRAAIRLLERIESFMYEKAAHITVITPSFRDHLISKGVPSSKISIIPNFVDTDFIRPLPKSNEFSRRHGLEERFVVCHAGNIGHVYDLETMLDAAALLRDEREVLFVLVGDGIAKPALEEKARALRLDNVLFVPWQPRESLPWLRASADVQVSLHKHGYARYSMPSKVYEIMASGRPIVAGADADTDVRRLVEAVGCGVCVEPGDADGLARAVLDLYADASLREEMGGLGRKVAVQSYSKQVVVSAYNDLLQQVAGSKAERPHS